MTDRINDGDAYAPLDLTYIPPNIWGGREATSEALKKLHGETNND